MDERGGGGGGGMGGSMGGGMCGGMCGGWMRGGMCGGLGLKSQQPRGRCSCHPSDFILTNYGSFDHFP